MANYFYPKRSSIGVAYWLPSQEQFVHLELGRAYAEDDEVVCVHPNLFTRQPPVVTPDVGRGISPTTRRRISSPLGEA